MEYSGITGLITVFSGNRNDFSEMIIHLSGLIENYAEMIGEDVGLIIKTDDTKHTTNGRKRRSKERGRDSGP